MCESFNLFKSILKHFFVGVVFVLIYTFFSILNVNAQLTNPSPGCTDNFSVDFAVDQIGRCEPTNAEVRIYIRGRELRTHYLGDKITYNMGDGTVVDYYVEKNNEVNKNNLPAGFTYGQYSSGPFNGFDYHSYNYTSSPLTNQNAEVCFYQITFNGERECGAVDESPTPKISEVVVWSAESSIKINSDTTNSFDICKGVQFSKTFNDNTGYNCNLTTLGKNQNGQSIDFNDTQTQYRDVEWTFNFSALPDAVMDQININYNDKSNSNNPVNLTLSAATKTYTINQKVRTNADVNSPTLSISSLGTLNAGTTRFTVKLEIQNYCNRVENVAIPSITQTYNIVTGPPTPTRLRTPPKNAFCRVENKPIYVQKATNTTIDVYHAFGTNPASLVGTSNLVSSTSNPVRTYPSEINPSEITYIPTITIAGNYTIYFVAKTDNAGLVCVSEALIVNLDVLSTLPVPAVTATTSNQVCVFSTHTFSLSTAPTDVTVGTKTFRTEYLWTVPANYTLTTPAGVAADTSLPNFKKYSVNTSDVQFDIDSRGGTNGYSNTYNVSIVRQFVVPPGNTQPACPSPTRNYSVTENRVGASVQSSGVVCNGGTLQVTLSNYHPNQVYSITLNDQNNQLYEANNIRLSGANQSVVITPSVGSSPATNTALTFDIISMTNITTGCTNDATNLTGTPLPASRGSDFPSTGAGITILPDLLPTPPVITNPHQIICPGATFTITFPAPPISISGGRSTELSYAGFTNSTFVSKNTTDIIFRANVASGIGDITGSVWRQLTSAVGGSRCPTSPRQNYTVSVSELPVANLNNVSQTVCVGSNVTLTFENFRGINTTNSFNIVVADNTNATINRTFNNVTPNAAGQVVVNYPLLPAGNYDFRIRSIQEGLNCTFRTNTGTINTGAVAVVVREQLQLLPANSIKLKNGTTELGGTTGRNACTNQRITVSYENAAGNLVDPTNSTVAGQAEYIWTIPLNWTLVSQNANKTQIVVTAPTGAVNNSTFTLSHQYPNAPNCVATATANINVLNGPSATTAGPDQLLCGGAGNTIFTLAGSAPIAGETGAWRIVDSPAGSTPTFTSSTIFNTNFTANLTGRYELEWAITRTGTTCSANTDTVEIFVQQAVNVGIDYPAFTAGTDQTVCGDVVKSVTLAGSPPLAPNGHTGEWRITSYTDLDRNTPALGTVNATFVDDALSNTTFQLNNTNPQYGVYVLTWEVSASGCMGAPATETVTISFNERPTLGNITLRQGVNNISIDNTLTPAEATTALCLTTMELGNGINLQAIATGAGASTGSMGTWSVVNGNGAISNPIPQVTYAGAGTTSNATDNATYTPVATDYNQRVVIEWTFGTSSYTGGTCGADGIKQVAFIIRRKLSIANTNTNIVVCNGDPLNLVFTNDGGLAGVTYNWNVSMQGNQFNTGFPSPFNSNSAANVSGTGDFNGLALTNTNNVAYRASIVVKVDNGGCEGPEETFFVTIMPSFDVTLPAASAVCSGTGFTLENPVSSYFDIRDHNNARVPIKVRYTIEDLTLTKGGIFKTPLTGAARTNLVGTENLNLFTAVPTVPTAIVSSLNIAAANLELEDNVNADQTVEITMEIFSEQGFATPLSATDRCTVTSKIYTLTVNPKPIITGNTTPIIVCSGDELVINPTTQIPATSTEFTWTIGTTTPNDADDTVAGNTASTAKASEIRQRLTGSPGANGTQSYIEIEYIVTPYTTGTLGTCTGTTATYTVIVLPKPALTTLPTPVVCSGDVYTYDITTSNIDETVAGVSVAYNYNTTLNGQFTSTKNTLAVGQDINITLTSVPTAENDFVSAPISITPTVTFTIAGIAYSCAASSSTLTVSIAPKPTITNLNTVNNAQICDTNTFNYTPTTNVTATGVTTDYTWTITPPAGTPIANFTVNGAAATGATFTGTGTSISDVIQFNAPLANPVVLTYSITPRITTTAIPAVPCTGTASTVNLTINPTPQITTPTADNKCSGENISYTATTLNLNPATGTLAWEIQNISTGLTGIVLENGIGDFSRTVNNTTTAAATFDIVFTPRVGAGANVCDGVQITKTITVSPGPLPTNRTGSTICSIKSLATVTSATTTANLSYTSPIAPAIAGVTFTYDVTALRNNAKITTTDIAFYNAAGVLITSDNTAGNPHFTNATTNATAISVNAAGDTINPLDFRILNTGTEKATIRLRLTPSTGVGAGVCLGVVQTINYEIEPIPIANNLPAESGTAPNTFRFEVCSGDRFTYVPTSAVTSVNMQYKFSIPAGGVPTIMAGAPLVATDTITGYPGSDVTVDRNTPGGSLTFVPVNTQSTPQYLSMTLVPQINGCDGIEQTFRIKVNPSPLVTLSAATELLVNTRALGVTTNTIEVCSNEAFTISVNGTVTNSTFNWTASNNNNVTNNTGTAYTRAGASAIVPNPVATATDIITGNFALSGDVAETVIYTISPSIPGAGAATCGGNSLIVSVIIHPQARITNTTANARNVCSGGNINWMPTSNVAGTTFQWEVISNNATVATDIQMATIAVPATVFTIPNGGAPVLPAGLTTTGGLSHIFINNGVATAQLELRFTPIVTTGKVTAAVAKVCNGTPSTVTINVAPAIAPTNPNIVAAITNGANYTYNPGPTASGGTGNISLTNAAYDWTAVVPAGVTLRNSGNAVITSALNTNNGIELNNVTNSTGSVQIVSIVLTVKLPGTTCGGTTINLNLHVLPQVIVTVTPTQNAHCFNTATGIAVSNNITTTATLTLLYNWDASNVGPNVREVTSPTTTAAVVPTGRDITPANINDLGTKVLTILNPTATSTDESVTYGVSATISYIYNNVAGVAQTPVTATSTVKNSVITVRPQPITTLFQERSLMGVYSDSGNIPPGEVQQTLPKCQGQTFTLYLDPSEGPTGTPGSTYNITSIPDTPPAGTTYGNLILRIVDNLVFIEIPGTLPWVGELRAVETDANGCVGEPVVLRITTTDRPIANAGADVTICEGATVELGTANTGTSSDGTALPAGATYRWTPTLFLDTTGATTSFSRPRPRVRPTQTVTYKLIVDFNGCQSIEDEKVVTVINRPANPTLSVAGGTAGRACVGTDLVITSTTDANTSIIEWSHNPTVDSATDAGTTVLSTTAGAVPGTVISGTKNEILTLSQITNNGYYFAKAIGNNAPPIVGCDSPTFSSSININFITSLGTPTIATTQGAMNTNNFLCSDGSTNLITLRADFAAPVTAASANAAVYTWYKKDDLNAGTAETIIISSNTRELKLSVPNDSGFYAVLPTISGCVGGKSPFKEVIILSKLSEPFIVSNPASGSVCEGDTITLTAQLAEFVGTVVPPNIEFKWRYITPAGTSNLTETSQILTLNGASANAHAGSYDVVAVRKVARVQAHSTFPVGTIEECLSPVSRTKVVTVITNPVQPVVVLGTGTNNPFCGDKGISRRFVMEATHPTPGTAYPTNVIFKWEHKTNRTSTTWTTVQETGINRLTLNNSTESGLYRVTAQAVQGTVICALAAVEYPAATAVPDLVVIRDSPSSPTFTPQFDNECDGNTTATTTFDISDGSPPFTVNINYKIPDSVNPTNVVQTNIILNNIRNGDTFNLLNPTGTLPIPLANKSGSRIIFEYQITSVRDINGCTSSFPGRAFELRVDPAPKPNDITAPVPVAAGGQQIKILDIADLTNPATMIKTAIICGGTVGRFEIPAVPNVDYDWKMTVSNNIATAGKYSISSGGTANDNFVEILFENVVLTGDNISVTVTDRTTGCTATKTLPVKVYGPITANAGSDRAFCPETKKLATPDFPEIIYTPKSYVTLGGSTTNPTASNTIPTVPSSGDFEYEWLKVKSGVAVKTFYPRSDLVAVPTSDFRGGTAAEASNANPEVSPLSTTTYVISVKDKLTDCTAVQDAVTVTVHEKPVINVSTPNIEICLSETNPIRIDNLVTGSLPPGGVAGPEAPSFTFFCENCQDSNTVREEGGQWVFDRTKATRIDLNNNRLNYGIFAINVLYNDSRACSLFLLSLEIEVKKEPVLSLTPIPFICENDNKVNIEPLVDGIALDYTVITANQTATITTSAALNTGEYRIFGPGVSYDTTRSRFVFDPNVAKNNTTPGHEISFIYKNALGCTAPLKTTNIQVKALPKISAATVGSANTRFDFGVCESTAGKYRINEGRIDDSTNIREFSATELPGVTYTGKGVTAGTTPGEYYFTPSDAGISAGDSEVHIITLEYEEQGVTAPTPTCKTSVTFNYTVWKLPEITFDNLPNVGQCSALFNLNSATVVPDLSAVKNIPNSSEGIYRDARNLPVGYVDKDSNGVLSLGTAAVIREMDDSTPPMVSNYQFDPSRVAIGAHSIRYEYTDGFGCKASPFAKTSTIIVLPPPSPALTPKDPTDTNPVFSARLPFKGVCPNDAPFEITDWGSTPPTGNTARFETDDTRLSAVISTRGVAPNLEYWFDPSELKSISSNIIDITKPFSLNLKYIVTDENMCEGFDIQPLSITPVPVGTITLSNDDCNGGPLQFLIDLNAIAPFEITYEDNLGNVPVVIKNASHTQKETIRTNAPTTYKIIKIVDRNSCVNTALPTSTATIVASPVANFTANPLLQTAPSKTVTFTNTSNTLNWKFQWDFGDGIIIEGTGLEGNIDITHADGSTTTGTYVNPVHTYKGPYGKFRIRMKATGAVCTDLITKDIEILPQIPEVDFDTKGGSVSRTGCAPLEVEFINNSKFIESNAFLWSFGDGFGISKKENPVYIFNKPGVYKITLRGSNDIGLPVIKEKIDYITVLSQPDAKFSVTPNLVYLPSDPVQFNNLSFDADTYVWDFGDGQTSTEKDPIYQYTKEGSYTVKLTAKSTQSTCEDVLEQEASVVVISGGRVNVPNVFTPGGDDDAVLGSKQDGTADYDPSSVNNNIFAPQVKGSVSYKMQVFDTWGNLIFNTDTQSKGWNGYYKGSKVPTGVYLYKLEVEFITGSNIERLGDITLIR